MHLRACVAVLVVLAGAAHPAGSEHAAAGGQPPPAAGLLATGAAVRPVDGAVVRAFAPPANPYAAGHRGVDLAAVPGEVVRAALPGVVGFSGRVAGRGWVTVRHGGGLDTTYGILDPRVVTAGQRVAAGQALGHLASDAAHLDWGARLHGAYIDPLSLLGRWRVRLVAIEPAAR